MAKTSKTIAITGANGLLGSTLVQHFRAAGWQVIGLVRSPSQMPTLTNVRYVAYNMDRPLSASTFKGVDVIVHTAYIKEESSGSHALKRNQYAAKQLLIATKHSTTAQLIFISTMSAHQTAVSVYAKQKLAIEKLFQQAGGTVLRSGLIIGNGGLVKQMYSFMKSKHLVPLIGGGKQPLQTIAVYDLANVIDRIITCNLTGLYTVATPKVYTYKNFYRLLGQRFGIHFIFVPVPISILGIGLTLAAKSGLTLSASKDNLLGLKHLQSIDTKSDLKRIGVKLDSLEQALKKTTITS